MIKRVADKPKIRLRAESAAGALLRIHLEAAEAFELESSEALPELERWLGEYAAGDQPAPFKGKIANSDTTNFQQEVLAEVAALSFGKVASYGEVAGRIGRPRASRAVGTACGRNPFPLLVPCHRVIGSGGQLGGFALDLAVKQALLNFEGVNIA